MLRLCWMLSALSVGLGWSLAEAAPPGEARVAVTGHGGCPDAASLAAALGGALPATRVRVDGQRRGSGPLVELIDEGGGYRVRAAGLERTFRDPERRCTERSRAAAVFAALALDPIGGAEPRRVRRALPPTAESTSTRPRRDTGTRPGSTSSSGPRSRSTGASGGEAAAEPTATAPSPVDVPAQVAMVEAPVAAVVPAPAAVAPVAVAAEVGPAPPAPRPLQIDAMLSVRGGAAPAIGDAAGLLEGGLGARAALLSGRFGASAGLAAGKTTDAGAGTGRYDLWRVAGDVGARAGGPIGDRLELFGEAGLLIGGHWLQGYDFSVNRQPSGLDLGVRLALEARLRIGSRLSPFLGIDAAVLPVTHPILGDGQSVGRTPYLWLGASLGLSLRAFSSGH